MSILNMIWQWFTNFVGWVVSVVVALLPRSPFADLDWSFAAEPLGWLNWLFPVRDLLTVAGVWLAAIAGFYAYMWILRKVGFVD